MCHATEKGKENSTRCPVGSVFTFLVRVRNQSGECEVLPCGKVANPWPTPLAFRPCACWPQSCFPLPQKNSITFEERLELIANARGSPSWLPPILPTTSRRSALYSTSRERPGKKGEESNNKVSIYDVRTTARMNILRGKCQGNVCICTHE